ncbi:MAG: dihydrodipicolinate synthase family protein [Clostridiales bacterium]|nr:dihydrodipicolinate synthase family protein [Clostridiales bacterium]
MNFVPRGIVLPVVTPTDEQGAFSEARYRSLLRFWMEGGVHGVFPFGTTGEFYAFGDDVLRRMIDISLEVGQDRLTVYAGANHITPKGVIKLARLAEDAGAHALSVLTPMFVSQTQEELYQYYKTISEGTRLPIVIYDNKGKTNVHVMPETVARLAELENIVALKDSTGDMTNTEECIRLTRHRDDFHVLMGRDTTIYAGLHYGCTGAITSCGNIAPRLAVDIYEKFQAGDMAGALDAQFRLSRLRIATNMATFPVVIKEGLRLIGQEAGDCQAPILPLNEGQRGKLAEVLREIQLL